MSKRKEIPIGTVVGRWTVLSLDCAGERRTKQLCQCECGSKKAVLTATLKSGRSSQCKDCGGVGVITHGCHNHSLYYIWNGMVSRCHKEESCGYEWYGLRGITVCDEWRHNFITFYDWCMENGYRKELQIDRRNNDSGYSPENCRWVSRSTNMRNTRQNRMITYNEETRCATEWAEIHGLPANVVRNRLHSGWNEIDAITEPVLERGKRVSINKNNKLGITGVYFNKSKDKYEVQVKRVRVGAFKTLDEAINARDKELKQLNGE